MRIADISLRLEQAKNALNNKINCRGFGAISNTSRALREIKILSQGLQDEYKRMYRRNLNPNHKGRSVFKTICNEKKEKPTTYENDDNNSDEN